MTGVQTCALPIFLGALTYTENQKNSKTKRNEAANVFFASLSDTEREVGEAEGRGATSPNALTYPQIGAVKSLQRSGITPKENK